MKGKTKVTFETIAARDAHLRAWKPGTYTIDKKDPLVVWV